MRKTLLITFFVIFSLNITAQRGNRGGQSNQGMRGSSGGQRPSAEEIIDRLDQDGDGLISKSEASEARGGRLAENFSLLDSNSDGFIDADELNNASKKNRKTGNSKELIKVIDANKDNKLDELEVAASENLKIKNNFKKIDEDSDGFLTEEELQIYFKDVKSKKKKKRKSKNNKE
ncbi:Ca2+-binding protein, EF-hand superfamily [Lutibacter oricola]|uniref:Ca2+-binding protein, EF-hand superfamily n=1 Tax=Lutibacter oricola TaxID=762486 RepID=A0A1H2WRM2_9FLAO|nr:hypothetical protein [Lutibacter oricola]SDW83205.1 Ca2+-binding protein, EF-hand superfamily [Lutibacter oricola]